jgi:hypothetical protein
MGKSEVEQLSATPRGFYNPRFSRDEIAPQAI